ncbi:unnamed protein product, partial [Prorocentrum cordatum]
SLTINSKDLKTARLYGVPLWSTAKPWTKKPPVVLSSSLEGAWDMLWAGRGSRAVRAARATRQRSLDELATPAPERRLEAGPRHGLPQGLAAAVGVVRHRATSAAAQKATVDAPSAGDFEKSPGPR